MIIYDLICECGFEVEGWFASLDDYNMQAKNHLISCPLCMSTKVSKKLCAPHINKSASDSANKDLANLDNTDAVETKEVIENVQKDANSQPRAPISYDRVATRPRRQIRRTKQPHDLPQDISKLAQSIGKVIESIINNSENVGKKFAIEARKIHNNEAPNRVIRGEATIAEFNELQEEGIECIPFTMPDKKDMN